MVDRGIKEFSTTADILEYQDKAEQVAIEALADFRSKVDANDTEGIVTRGALPSEDLDVNTETLEDAIVDVDSDTWDAETGVDEEGDWYGYYGFDSDANMEDKAAVLYGFQHLDGADDSDLEITGIRLRNRNGGLFDQIDLSSIDIADGKLLLYDDPLVVADDSTYLEAYVEDGGAESTIPLKPLIRVAETTKTTFDEAERFIRN